MLSAALRRSGRMLSPLSYPHASPTVNRLRAAPNLFAFPLQRPLSALLGSSRNRIPLESAAYRPPWQTPLARIEFAARRGSRSEIASFQRAASFSHGEFPQQASVLGYIAGATAFVLIGAVVVGLGALATSPSFLARCVLETAYSPATQSIGPEFDGLHPAGFEQVIAALDGPLRQEAKLCIIDGMSGIGKTHALQTHLKGQTGVIYYSFRQTSPSHSVDTPSHSPDTPSSPVAHIPADAWLQTFETVLRDFREESKKMPIIILDDVSYGLKHQRDAPAILSWLLGWCTEKGLASVLFVGSESVIQAIEDSKGPSGQVSNSAKKFVLSPIPWEKLEPAVKQAAKRKWKDDAADRSKTEEQKTTHLDQTVKHLGLLFGSRMKDIANVLEATTATGAMKRAHDIIAAESTLLRNFTKDHPEASPVLLALLCSDNGVLQGSNIKREWEAVIPKLVESGFVRHDRGTSDAGVLRFHHTAVEAVARAHVVDGALSNASQAQCDPLGSAHARAQFEALRAVDALPSRPASS